MRKLVLLVAVSLLAVFTLTALPAWAEDPDFLVASSELPTDGGCVLPNLTGLSEDEQEVAWLTAGFEARSEKAVAVACPTTFKCTSIGNCGIGPICAISSLGSPCCTVGGGLARCCINGNNITVVTCPCKCTGNPCAIQCPNSSNVSLQC